MQDFSPRLARGLRRDLFRRVDDHTRDAWQLFKRRQAVLDRPYRSLRDARAVYQRAQTALWACSTRTRDMGTASVTEAVVLLPDRLEHPDGVREDLLRVLRVNVAMDGLQLSSHELEVGLISQHAVERLFLRMATTSAPSVLSALSDK